MESLERVHLLKLINLFIFLFIIIYVKLAFVTESLVELFVMLFKTHKKTKQKQPKMAVRIEKEVLLNPVQQDRDSDKSYNDLNRKYIEKLIRML